MLILAILLGPFIALIVMRVVAGEAVVEVVWKKGLRWLYVAVLTIFSIILLWSQIHGLEGDEGPAWFAVLMITGIFGISGLLSWFVATLFSPDEERPRSSI